MPKALWRVIWTLPDMKVDMSWNYFDLDYVWKLHQKHVMYNKSFLQILKCLHFKTFDNLNHTPLTNAPLSDFSNVKNDIARSDKFLVSQHSVKIWELKLAKTMNDDYKRIKMLETIRKGCEVMTLISDVLILSCMLKLRFTKWGKHVIVWHIRIFQFDDFVILYSQLILSYDVKVERGCCIERKFLQQRESSIWGARPNAKTF